MRFCQETGKQCYETRGDVFASTRGMAKGRGRNRPTKTEAYFCDVCDAWHLASAVKKGRNQVKVRRKGTGG